MQLLNILKQKTNNEQVKRSAVSYMEETKSFEYCRKVLMTLIEKAKKMIADLDDGSNQGQGILKILEKLAV
ncbi:Geranylgeranyl pyrophosphate synthase [Erysiphe necator]|nr:Geranylgeranyl pyrophosphate synthase [Erysiphe necator]